MRALLDGVAAEKDRVKIRPGALLQPKPAERQAFQVPVRLRVYAGGARRCQENVSRLNSKAWAKLAAASWRSSDSDSPIF